MSHPKAILSPIHPACFLGRIVDLQLPRRPLLFPRELAGDPSRPNAGHPRAWSRVFQAWELGGVCNATSCVLSGTMCRCAERKTKTHS